MIGKVLRGGQVGGLVRYLYGPGRANEHLEPRIVAGWRPPERLEPPVSDVGVRDFRRLVGLLREPAEAAGMTAADKPVYHLVAAAAKADSVRGTGADRPLSDGEWAEIAEDLMDRTGLAKKGASDGVRWIAVRHDQPGAEHIHVVATLATESGRRVSPRNDFYRIGEGCRAAEDRYGLRRTGERDRTAPKRPSRAESEKAARQGNGGPARESLRRQVRTAAAGADGVDGFLGALKSEGLLVRLRYSDRNPDQLTGYAVAEPWNLAADGGAVYYSGGKLAADLTLPKLAKRWPTATAAAAGSSPGSATAGERPAAGLSASERTAAWTAATEAASQAERAIAGHATDPAAAADAAWAAADFLAATARLVGGRSGGPLAEAAAEFDRAARDAWGQLPNPSAAGSGLRAAAGFLAAARVVRRPETAQLLALLGQLATLTDALVRMRETQARAVQAAAARSAAEGLRAESDRRCSQIGVGRAPARSASNAVSTDRHRTAGPAVSSDRHRGRPGPLR